MKRYIAANWKLNPSTLKQAQSLLSGYKHVSEKGTTVIICPPMTWLPLIAGKGSTDCGWGAQDCFWENAGAYTGTISPSHLKNLGVDYVIIGHSEQREHLGVTDEQVNKKVKTALKARLKPIVCIGGGPEAKKQEDINRLLGKQMEKAFNGIRFKPDSTGIILAYEPIWAIGTGRPASAKHAAEAAFYIRWWLQKYHGQKAADETPVLYGGSVNSKNSALLLKKSNLNGFLVGGASLNASEFMKIVGQTNTI